MGSEESFSVPEPAPSLPVLMRENLFNLATLKRKRGRPRRVELREGFDIHLVREFEKRPELYDHSSPNYRDKAYVDESWEQLSQILGYSSTVVKDRMIQLKNRYQIEKRRIENLQTGCPKRTVESKWALYDSLSFLPDHIPVRRSFRTMNIKRHYGEYAVKHEQETDLDSEGDQGDGGSKEQSLNRKGSIQVRSYGQLIPVNSDNGIQNRPQPTRSTVAYGDAFPRLQRMPPERPSYPPQQQRQPMHIDYQRHQASHSVNRVAQGAEKFLAFGRFLTSSLIELPESQALMLVDQFTSELVQSYLKHHDQPSQPNVNGGVNVNDDSFVTSNGHSEE